MIQSQVEFESGILVLASSADGPAPISRVAPDNILKAGLDNIFAGTPAGSLPDLGRVLCYL